MAQGRKYAALPDLDESPDTYETPDLTDDNSTLRTSTVRSPSPSGSTASSADLNPSISTSKLQPNQARTQFTSSRVDARDTDFSDRVSSKRKAYIVSSRDQDGGEDWDSEDEEESLQRRLARLNREVLEVRGELDKRKNETNGDAPVEEDDNDVAGKLAELSAALDKMRVSQSAQARLDKSLSTHTKPTLDDATIPESTRGETVKDAPDTQSLNKVADFDTRLATLERQLGITSLDMPEASKTSAFSPIIPTLSLLDRQLALLTSSPTQPHIEALAQKLQQAQQGAAAAGATEGEQAALSQEDMTKLRALYALLPTLTSLSPTLPPLLARLRSLRTLHANAATASQTLDEVERRQDEADKEIREWRDGLKKVEDAVARAEGGMRENNTAVEGWVKDLEERVRKLT